MKDHLKNAIKWKKKEKKKKENEGKKIKKGGNDARDKTENNMKQNE